MQIINSCDDVRSCIKDIRLQNKELALVPTMGFLHRGHISLINEAKKVADIVMVTIFVNKEQFNNSDDYDNYPIDIESDVKKLEAAGVDLLFLPMAEEIYTVDEFRFEVDPDVRISNILCGKYRRGHFQGVCKILMKLFTLINPDRAVFGLKDFQQYLIVKKMIEYFKFDIEAVGVETVREESGLAMSSRNANLKGLDYEKAAFLYLAMTNIKNELKNTGNINLILQNGIRQLEKNHGFKIDYFEIRKEGDLSLVEEAESCFECRIFVAAYIDNVRLIDNLKI